MLEDLKKKTTFCKLVGETMLKVFKGSFRSRTLSQSCRGCHWMLLDVTGH